MARFVLTDFEWSVISLLLPNIIPRSERPTGCPPRKGCHEEVGRVGEPLDDVSKHGVEIPVS